MAWQKEAACRDVDPEMFFPVASEGTKAFEGQSVDALAVCARCPVWRQCRAEAVRTDAVGIWGRATEKERRHRVSA